MVEAYSDIKLEGRIERTHKTETDVPTWMTNLAMPPWTNLPKAILSSIAKYITLLLYCLCITLLYYTIIIIIITNTNRAFHMQSKIINSGSRLDGRQSIIWGYRRVRSQSIWIIRNLNAINTQVVLTENVPSASDAGLFT